jgi:hypothetical protein
MPGMRRRRSLGLAPTIDSLLDALGQLPDILATGDPEERKAVVRVFLQEIRIEKTTRQAILSWHRLPRVDESPINGGAEGARTPDPKTASLVLSQLSYSPTASPSLLSARSFVKIGEYLRSAQVPAACRAAFSAAS